jgi:hypothetical protein
MAVKVGNAARNSLMSRNADSFVMQASSWGKGGLQARKEDNAIREPIV